MHTDWLKFVDVLVAGKDVFDLGNIKAIAIGDAMLDCHLNGVADACQESVPVVKINQQQQLLNGAANIAVTAHNLGAEVNFLSVIGDDWQGALLRQKLESSGVSTKHILTQLGRQTLAKHWVMAATQPLVIWEQGSTDAIDSKTEQALIAQLRSCWTDCDAVIVSDCGCGILTAGVIQAIAQLQQSQPRVLVVDSEHLAAYHQLGITAVKLNYNHAAKLLGLEVLPTKSQGNTRANQIAKYEPQLRQITSAQAIAVSLDEQETLVFEQIPKTSGQQLSDCHLLTVTGDTLICALTITLAVKATQKPTERRQGNARENLNLGSSLLFGSPRKYWQTLNDLVEVITSYRASGQRLVFTNGCFDILHAGHVFYLNRAKALGDVLIVGVNSDASISRLKGASRPINSLSDRLQVLAALSCVDLLVAFDQDTPVALIQLIRPDIYVKGGDYTKETLPEASLVEQLGGTVELIPFVKNCSTTSTIERIRSAKLEDSAK